MTLSIALIAAFLVLAFVGAGLKAWTLWLLAILVAFSLLGLASPAALLVGWLLILPPLIIGNFAPLRRRLLSAWVMQWARRKLPKLSRTEQEALEAGETWWEAELFRGQPDWPKFLSFPLKPLTEREQSFLDGPVAELCRMLDDWQIRHQLYDLPPQVWQFLKENRFFGLVLPAEYGGLGFSARAHSEVVLKIASRSLTAAVTVMVPNSLGPGELIRKYGTPEQRAYYLPRLARGEEIPCFALTSPEAGSDASAMTDIGIVCRRDFQGQRNVLGILLNWNKRYITLAPVATLLGLAFRLYDPERLLGAGEDLGITVALIPTATPGVEIGQRHNPMDIPFQNGPTQGHNVFIPLDWVVGGRAGIGQGWRMLMECLAEGRGISLPALASAAAKLACRTTLAYACIRRQFDVPISALEGVTEVLAKIGGLTYLIEAGRIVTLAAIDGGIRPAVASAILKYHTTEAMRSVVNAAMDVHGGKAIMQGPRNHLGTLYQAVPISITVEGANILTRAMIIYGQGAIRCHPYLLAEMRAASALNLVAFDQAFIGHLRLALSNLIRATFLGVTHSYLARSFGPYWRHLQHLSRFSAVLAALSDLSFALLGGELKRRERLSARLGDILSHLYLASALLRYHLEADPSESERPLLEWGMTWCLFRTEQAVVELLANYPIPWVGKTVRWFVLPWGRRFGPPSDRLDQAIVSLLQTPGPVRDRLTAGVFLPQDPNEPITRLEQALIATLEASTAERKLRQAIKTGQVPPGPAALEAAQAQGLLTPEEDKQLRTAQALVQEVIAVDAFPKMTEQASPWFST